MTTLLSIASAMTVGCILGRAHLRRALVRQLLEHADYYGATLIARDRHEERS